VAPGPVSVRPTIDRAWLDAAASRDPIAHAYAVWDLERFPDRARFVSAVSDDATIGYLLIWPGRSGIPVVHAFGDGRAATVLASALPTRPLVAVVPPELVAAVERARGPTRAVPLLCLVASGISTAPEPPAGPGIRRLESEDRDRLAAWASAQHDPNAAEYPALDPGTETIWASVDGERIRGVTRAAVRLPALWLLGGIYVDPAARGKGVGLALVRTALAAGRDAGASVALYVREDRPAARALYARAGFVERGRRVWMDAGSGLEP
jgi:GNAT superfamily N-acetyltransferase